MIGYKAWRDMTADEKREQKNIGRGRLLWDSKNAGECSKKKVTAAINLANSSVDILKSEGYIDE